MYKIAIEKKVSKKMNSMTIEDIFGQPIHRWKVIVLADEPKTVVPYPEDKKASKHIDTSGSVTLSEYMKKRWLTK